MLPALRLTVTAAARQLGVSRQTLHRILAGKASVTAEMSVRLGKSCGNGSHLWLRLQQDYDLWHAARALKRKIKKIPTHDAASIEGYGVRRLALVDRTDGASGTFTRYG